MSQYSSILAPIAVNAVTRLLNPPTTSSSDANSSTAPGASKTTISPPAEEQTNVDLRDIRIVKKVGGTIDDTELVEGLVLEQTVVAGSGGPTRMEKAKIAVCQFQLSSPKPDVSQRTGLT